MDILKINPRNNKVLFFSDLHLGVHQDSPTWHKIALDLASWIDGVMKQEKLNTIFFAGDVFHNRHEIGVNTLHIAKKFFDILSNYQIYIIPGNHDCFLSSSVEVNSVKILEKSNITVFNEPTTVEVSDKKVTFCPWNTDSRVLNEVDMLVGHFEIVNFKMNATKICEHGEDPAHFLNKAKSVITGHFHCRSHRQYEDRYVLYLGSPYEMDFGDRDQTKGVSIIDFDDLSVNFIQNEITPKHYRIEVTGILNKKYENLNQLIKGNIISLYVDTKFDALTLDMLITKLTQYGPLQFRTEFNILDDAQNEIKETKKLSIDIETALGEFIEIIDTRATKKEVLDKCLELYKVCLNNHE